MHNILSHGKRVQIVIVDNASTDGSGAHLAERFTGHPSVTVLSSPANRGFSAGCNQGIDHALDRWPDLAHVLVLNPDARLRTGTLQTLRSCAERHPRAGIVGCRVVDKDGSTWFANGRIPKWTLQQFHTCPPGNKTEFETDFVTSCCMLLDAQMLRKGVRFDERFFLYGEDADLCLTVQARGRSCYVTQAATVDHRSGSRSGRKVLDDLCTDRLYHSMRGKVLLAKKHLSLPQRWSFYLTVTAWKPALAVLTGKGIRWVAPWFRGLAAGWMQSPHRS